MCNWDYMSKDQSVWNRIFMVLKFYVSIWVFWKNDYQSTTVFKHIKMHCENRVSDSSSQSSLFKLAFRVCFAVWKVHLKITMVLSKFVFDLLKQSSIKFWIWNKKDGTRDGYASIVLRFLCQPDFRQCIWTLEQTLWF